MTATDTQVTAGTLPLLPARVRATSLWRDAFRRLLRNRGAVAGLAILPLLAIMALVAPLIAPYDPNAIAPVANLKGPSAAHLFGTDQFGRDILSRIIFGTRLSFEVGFIAVSLAMLCGIPLGLM